MTNKQDLPPPTHFDADQSISRREQETPPTVFQYVWSRGLF